MPENVVIDGPVHMGYDVAQPADRTPGGVRMCRLEAIVDPSDGLPDDLKAPFKGQGQGTIPQKVVPAAPGGCRHQVLRLLVDVLQIERCGFHRKELDAVCSLSKPLLLTVRVSTQRRDRSIEIRVEDNGPGISEFSNV